MAEKNRILAEATYRSGTGHLRLTRFEVVVDGKQVSTLDPTEDPRSPHIPRILLLFHEYSTPGDVTLPKTRYPWDKLWLFLRKQIKGQLPNAGWYTAMFGDVDLRLLFPADSDLQRPRNCIPFDRDRFPASAISVRIRENDAPEWLPAQRVEELLAQLTQVKRREPLVLQDRAYAIALVSELQVGDLDDDAERVAIGKAIWLSRLGLLRDLLHAELLSDDGHIGRLRRILDDQSSDWEADSNFVTDEAITSWKVRFDAVKRVIESGFLREPAERVGFQFNDLSKEVSKLLLAAIKFVELTEDQSVRSAKLQAVAVEVADNVRRLWASLNDRIAVCRLMFTQLWKECRS